MKTPKMKQIKDSEYRYLKGLEKRYNLSIDRLCEYSGEITYYKNIAEGITENFNGLSKEYNNLMGERKVQESKISLLESICADHLKNRDILCAANLSLEKDASEKIKGLKSRLFWLWLTASITTATTVSFIIYHISKAL